MAKTLTLYCTPNPENIDHPIYEPTKKAALSSAHALADLDDPDEWLEEYRERAEELGFSEYGDEWYRTPLRYINTTPVERCVVSVGGRKETCALLNGLGYSESSEVIAYVGYDLHLAKTVELTPFEVHEKGIKVYA